MSTAARLFPRVLLAIFKRHLAHTRALVALLAVAYFCAVSAWAQTAHLSGATVTLGSGFSDPSGVAVDGTGNVYVADFNNAVKEMPAGCASSSCVMVLGGGFSEPNGVAVDSSGNVYVADVGDNAVKKMPAGCASSSCVTVLGGGFGEVVGVAVDGHGNVYVADDDSTSVKEIPASCIAGANNASCVTSLGGGFGEVISMAIDSSGNVYVTDGDSTSVKEIPASCIAGANDAGCVTLLGGGFSEPWGIAVDGSGNVYVGDHNNDAVKEVPSGCLSSGCVVSLPGTFSGPKSVAVDGSGNVYATNGSTLTEIMLRAANFFSEPVNSTTPGETLFFTFDSAGKIGAPAALTQGAPNLDFAVVSGGTCAGGTSYSIGSTCTVDVAFTPKYAGLRMGAVDLPNSSGAAIAAAFVFGVGTGPQTAFGTTAGTTFGGGFNNPFGVAVDGSGNIYVADLNNRAVKEIPMSCASSGCVTTLGGGFSYPDAVAVDGGGNVYVADEGTATVSEIPAGCTSSSCVTPLGGGFALPAGVAVDGSGNVYVTDQANAAVDEMPAGCASSSCVTTLGGGFSEPTGVAVDSGGKVYVTDESNAAVYEMPAGCANSGCVTKLGGSFSAPQGIAVDASGTMYIADPSAPALKAMPAGCASSSCVTTVGNFTGPNAVALDAGGNIYLANSDNSVVEIVRSMAPTLTFAATNAGKTSSDSPQTVTLLNIGNAALTFPLPVSGGQNPSIAADFTLGGSGTCPQLTSASSSAGTLVSGAGCTLPISFTPGDVEGSVSGSLVVTDNSLNVANTTQTIALAGTALGTLSAKTVISSEMLTVGQTGVNFTPVTGTGGTGTLTYALSPATLPAGLSFSTSSGAITGAPTAATEVSNGGNISTVQPVSYTVSVTDADNISATASFSLTVNDAVTATTNLASMVVYVGQAGTSFTPVAGAGGTGTLTYSVTPALPAGLSLSKSSGAISGDPTAISPTTAYTMQVTDANSVSATASFTLTVNAAPPTPLNFNSVPVGTSATQTITFTVNATGTITAPQVLTQGAAGLDFADAGTGSCTTNGTGHSYNAGDSCTVDIVFTPRYPGLRSGAVNLLDSSGAVIATGYVYGVGSGPQVVYGTDTTTTLGGGFSAVHSVAVDASGNVYTASANLAAGTGYVTKMPAGCANSSCVTQLAGGYNFSVPQALTVDGAGNVFVGGYIDGSSNGFVDEIPAGCTSSSCVTTLFSGFGTIYGVAVDGVGNVYATDYNSSDVLIIPPSCQSASCIETVGNSTITPAPGAVGLDAAGNLYLTTYSPSIVMLPAGCRSNSCMTTLVAGGGSDYWGNIAVDAAGNLYFGDNGGVEILPAGCTSTSCITTITQAISLPLGMALDNSGNLYVASGLNDAVYEINRTTAPSFTFATTVAGQTSSSDPQTVGLLNIGNMALTLPPSSSAPDPAISTNFTLDSSNTCPAVAAGASSPGVLAADASCALAVDFAPLSGGTLNGSLVLTDNSLNPNATTTQTISLSGTATVTPTQLVYVSAPPSPIGVGGNAGTIQVALEDALNNVATNNSTASVSLSVTGPSGYSETYGATATNGVAIFDLSIVPLQITGTYTYTATSAGLAQAQTTGVVAVSVPPATGSISTANLSANLVTLQLTSSATGTRYFTLLSGNSVPCGTAAQTVAGEDSTGAAAFRIGSLPLTAGTTGNYTVRNLTASTTYTVCFTPDGLTAPVTANVTTAAATTPNPGAWANVGSAGFSPGTATYESMAFSPDGTPYVAFQDANSSNKATVMEYTGGSWQVVGSAGFSADQVDSISLAFSPDGTPYVAYEDLTNYVNKATVMEYNGTSWVTVGNAGFSPGNADSLVLAFSPNGTPYVAFEDGNSAEKATVMEYTGGSWQVVGNAGFSAGIAGFESLAFSPNGTPYVAYADVANGYTATVMEYTGGSWQVVGSAGFSAGIAAYESLAFSPNGTPYVAYADYSGIDQYATVMEYNGTSWVPVGSTNFSEGEAQYESLAFSPNGTPYLAYEDESTSSNKATVMAYNGTSWVTVGSTNFSEGQAQYESLAFSPNGTPAVAYQDAGNGSKATVMALVQAPTATTDAATGVGYTGATLNGTVNDDGSATAVTFEYGTSTSYGTTVAATTPSGGTVAAGSGATATAVSLTGLAPNTTYHFRVDATGNGVTVDGADMTFTTAVATPTVASVSPSSGPVTGGTTVTLTGTSFTGATAVNFGSVPATSFIVVNATTITAVAPPNTGTVDITVTTPAGTSATSAADQFTYVMPLAATTAVASTTLTTGSSASFTPVTAANGVLPYSFSVLPALPAGLTMNSGTGAITGTPTAVSANTSYTVTVMDAVGETATANFALTVNAPDYVVNTTADNTTGSCTALTSTTSNTTDMSGGVGICTLRAALTEAATAGAANIYFDTTVFAASNTAAQNTIMLANGTLTIPNNTTITGLTAAGAVSANNPQGNLVTVDGTDLNPDSIFVVNSGSTVSIANLVVQSESTEQATSNGIENHGTLSFSNSAFLNYFCDSNHATLDNTGTLTVTGSTFAKDYDAIFNESGATASVTGSTFTANLILAIENFGTATVAYSTFNGQSVRLNGAIYTIDGAQTTLLNITVYGTTLTGVENENYGAIQVSGGTVNLGNSILYGNTVLGVPSDVYVDSGTLNDLGGNYIGVENGTTLHSAAINLAPLGNYGGPAQTLLPLPGSPAICAGLAANIAAGATTDQRGVPNRNTTYPGYTASAPCVDAGAVQTNYSLAFAQQPTDVVQNATMSPAPTVQLDEQGVPFVASSVTVPLTLTSSPTGATLTGGSASTSTSTGVATYSGLSINQVSTGDVLTATLALNAATPPLSLTATSSTFNVLSALTATQAIATETLIDGTAASFTPVTRAGGTGTLTYSISPALPASLSFNTATGAITGTPTTTLTATTFTVTVTDANNQTATANFSLTVNAAVTATTAIASTTLTENHAATSFIPVTGAGGTGTLTYSISPALPAGLSFNTATGAITGTPTTTLTATTFTVTVTDTNKQTATANFTLAVNAAVTATTAVASTTLTQNHAATSFTPVTGSGGTGTLSYAITTGTLPTGLSFNTATGAISGTPTATLTATTFTVTVTDANNQTATANFILTVNAAVTATTAVASTTLTQNHAATSFIPVTGSGGTGTLSYSITAGTLPRGLSFNTATGAITGTPTVTLAATVFTVTVTDANGATATATFSLTVSGTLTATTAVASTTLTQNHAATSFTPVTGSGGTGTLSYAITTGTLPTGLSFNTATGAISGTPTATLTATTFTVTVTDANNQTATANFTLAVNAAVTATTAVASTTLTQNHVAPSFIPVTGSGGTGTLSYAITAGTLPAGLSFNTTTGAITGTPTVTLAATTFTVTVTDTNGATATATFSLTVSGTLTATTAVASTTLTQNHAAASFTPVTGNGGTGTLTYSITTGTLPTGLSFSTSTGTISGTPTSTLTATSFTVTVTDANGATATANFSLTVNPAVAATTEVAATTLTENHAATSFIPVKGSGGTGTLSYAITTGTLPTGLSLNTATGAISGTPTATLTATTFTVTVTDANGATATATFSLTVSSAIAATTAVASTTLTQNHAATSFTPVTGSGGTGTLNYAITIGTLPTGLSFNTTTGAITGTPTATLSVTTFTVTVTDVNDVTATANFILTVNPAVVATTEAASTTLTTNQTAMPFTPVTGSGGTPALTYSITTGTLPTGLSFNTSTGAITGTPTAAMIATQYTITVTDANGATATANFSLAVQGMAPTASSVTAVTSPYGATTGIVVTATESGTAGAVTGGVVTFGVTGNAGGSFNPATCTLTSSGACTTTYTPSGTLAAGTYTGAITVSFGAVGSYLAASANNTLTISAMAPVAATINSVSTSYGSTTGIVVTATESGSGGPVTGGIVTFGVAGNVGGSFNPTTCTLSASGTCTTTYTPSGTLAAGTYVSDLTASFAAVGNYAAASAASTLSIGDTTQTITFTPATPVTYGVGPITLTAKGGASGNPVTFTLNSGPATLSGSILNVTGAGAISITANQAGNANFSAATAVTATILVNKATPAISLASNVSTVLVENPVTLTATVNSTVSVPTGSVTFLDGTTPLGTVQLTTGVAALTTSFTVVGPHSITAVYSGDNNFVTLTSSATSVLAADFNLAFSGLSSQTILPGGTASYSLTLSPLGTTTFPSAVALSVTGLPAGATYSFSPGPTIASGAGASNVTLTITVPQQKAMLHQPTKLLPVSLATLLLLPFAGTMRRRARKLSRLCALLLLLIGSAVGMTTLTGCGADNGFLAQPQQGYSITVTATGGALTHSTTVTLTVE